MSDRRITASLALLAVAAVAVALRAGPLHASPLPFNPDGIIHARHARAAISQGRFPLAQLGTDDLFFTSFLSIVSTVLGDSPLYIAQPTIAVVGTVPCLLAVAYAKRIGRGLGWTSAQVTLGALLAGGLLAVEGVYLHRSMPTDEQTLGLLFVPLLVVTVARAVPTGSMRLYVIAGLVLAVLPVTHNLDSIVAAMALTGVAALVAIRQGGSVLARALAFAGGGWILLVGYTYGSAQLLPLQIIQSERITSVPGLFLAWIVVLVALFPWFVRASWRTQRILGAGALAMIFGLATLHAIVPIVPGTRPTPLLLLVGVLPLFLIAIFGAWVTPVVTRTWTGVGLAAIFVVTVVLIAFSLTAGLTPDYLNLAYRSQTFLHLPAMTFTGIGVVALLRNRPALDRRHTSVIVSLVLIAAALSIPIAFSGLSLLSYKGVTTPAEYNTAQFAAESVPGTWAADNHIARLTWGLEDVEEPSGTQGTTLPVREWTRSALPPPTCPTVIQQSWTTVGAQLFPAPPRTISAQNLAWFRTANHVVYAAGTSDPLWLVAPRNGTTSCNA